MKPANVRTFIALELDDKIQQQLKTIQDSLKKTNADVAWVHPKNIHLTLLFIGNVDSESLQNLRQTIKQAIQGIPSFKFQPNQYGWFPNKANPRVLWIGVDLGKKCLERITQALSKHVASFCDKTQKEHFSAHITIGRVRSNKNIAQLFSKLNEMDFDFTEKQKISHITLFKSQLTSSGPEYTIIERFPLA